MTQNDRLAVFDKVTVRRSLTYPHVVVIEGVPVWGYGRLDLSEAGARELMHSLQDFFAGPLGKLVSRAERGEL